MLVPAKSLEQFVAVWLCSVILLTKLPVVPDERENKLQESLLLFTPGKHQLALTFKIRKLS